MWHALLVLVLLLIAACRLASVAVGRWAPRAATALRIAAGAVARVATSGVFLGIALQAAEHGGWWWLVTAACGLLGLFGFAVVGVIAFALIRGDATRSPAS